MLKYYEFLSKSALVDKTHPFLRGKNWVPYTREFTGNLSRNIIYICRGFITGSKTCQPSCLLKLAEVHQQICIGIYTSAPLSSLAHV